MGGLRSTMTVDQNSLRPYYYAVVLCIHENGWKKIGNLTQNIVFFDLGDIEPGLRGFSEAIRVGRYAYLAPLSSRIHSYSSKIIRVDLGPDNIGLTVRTLKLRNGSLRDITDILDLSQVLAQASSRAWPGASVQGQLAGFSSIFNSGKYLILVPFRNEHEPQNGQRGHGIVARLDMNKFDITGVIVYDLTMTQRNQIPSFPDTDLRGFSAGFASGKYAVFVPFYNGIFSGKVARIDVSRSSYESDEEINLQELDLIQDSWNDKYTEGGLDIPEFLNYDKFKGFRGGFISLWRGLPYVPPSAGAAALAAADVAG